MRETSEELAKLHRRLLRKVGEAFRDFELVREGDRVALAVSGGTDSLSLLRLLMEHVRGAPVRYSLAVVHVAGDARGPLPVSEPLRERLASTRLPAEITPLSLPADEPLPMNCHRCSWNRRRTIFLAAERLGCNVVALAHHADDLAETTLMNLLHHGRVETMAPRVEFFGGKIVVIRPLAYVLRRTLQRYADLSGIAPLTEPCPESPHSQREVARELIRKLLPHSRDLKHHLLMAGLRGTGALPRKRQ